MATPKSLQEARITARNSVRKKDSIGREGDRDQGETLHETLEYRESAITENKGKRLSLSLSLSRCSWTFFIHEPHLTFR
jgi:hypothetical protein